MNTIHESEKRRDNSGEDDAQARHDAEEHAAYLLGQCVGVEDIMGRLLVKAGEEFARSRDEQANMLRGISFDLDIRAKALRKTHESYRKEHNL